jgi:hypothetical protein
VSAAGLSLAQSPSCGTYATLAVSVGDGEVVRVMEAEALLVPSPGLLDDADLSGARPNVDTNSRITTSAASD